MNYIGLIVDIMRDESLYTTDVLFVPVRLLTDYIDELERRSSVAEEEVVQSAISVVDLQGISEPDSFAKDFYCFLKTVERSKPRFRKFLRIKTFKEVNHIQVEKIFKIYIDKRSEKVVEQKE
jgi:hypothetical protein